MKFTINPKNENYVVGKLLPELNLIHGHIFRFEHTWIFTEGFGKNFVKLLNYNEILFLDKVMEFSSDC